ncbi:MAG: hypothetical protein GF383_08215 [Candidatus Lokiarchaeota archaeon]|nr:hypothetical protein [Candidatus Lokiarchaeota archaeon]MBD3340333.1 hypothetical protein [Candidatus Lokiarchaeota archaeon]
MQNRLLEQYNTVISSQWMSQIFTEPYEPLNHRQLFELAYHTCNNVSTRNIFIKISQDDDKGGSKAILYCNNKTFTTIEALDDELKVTMYFNDESNQDKLASNIHPLLIKRKNNFNEINELIQNQILKTILVERKLDECANLVMIKDINRKIYFAIGDARESAAVVPLFMETEGSNLVQLALNKWMATAQRLQPEETFPETHVQGLLKNLMQIKKWVLAILDKYLDK